MSRTLALTVAPLLLATAIGCNVNPSIGNTTKVGGEPLVEGKLVSLTVYNMPVDAAATTSGSYSTSDFASEHAGGWVRVYDDLITVQHPRDGTISIIQHGWYSGLKIDPSR